MNHVSEGRGLPLLLALGQIRIHFVTKTKSINNTQQTRSTTKKNTTNQQHGDSREEQHVVENVGHGGRWKKKPVAYPANQEKPAETEYTVEAAKVVT